MIVYYVDDSITAPEPVECEQPGYPLSDAKGRTMYENSHYRSLAFAWEALRRSTEAGQSLLANRIIDTRERLRRLEQEAADEVVRHDAIMRGIADFESAKIALASLGGEKQEARDE